MIERRKAIVGLAAIFAVAMGRRGTAQQATAWTGTTSSITLNQPPQWFMFTIEEGGGLKFEYKGETVSITADELWTALKG